MKRKITAILLGLLTTILIGFTSILWGQLFSTLADTLSSDYTRKLFGVRLFDSSEINDYYLFYLIGLAITLGLMVTFIVWDFKDKFRRRLLIYIPFLILILGFSIYNYAHFDYIMQPDIQAFFNLLIIFLGLVCAIQLWKLKTKSTDGIILKYLILFLIIFCSVLIPLYFSFAWFFERIGFSKTSLNFNIPIITTIAGLITSIITLLKYIDDKKRIEKEIKN